MDRLIVKIEYEKGFVLSLAEIKYVIKTICINSGISWYFVNPEFNGNVELYYGNNFNCNASVKINPLKITDLKDESNIQIIQDYNLFFIDFKDISDKPLVKYCDSYHFNNDILYTSFFLLSAKDEKNIKKTKWDTHNILDSFLFKNKLLHIPLIDLYSKFLKKYFSEKKYVDKWPHKAVFALALSHDIDYPEMIKSIETLRYLYQNKKKSIHIVSSIYKGKNNFWKFNDWLELESEYGVKSAFYFCSYKGSLLRYFLKAPDPFYDIQKNKFKDIAKLIIDSGYEIGLHSSFLSYKSLERFCFEKNKLEIVFKINISGNRHHYWHMHPNCFFDTVQIHEDSGLVYDSSIAFEQHSGFRLGICSPFHLWNSKTNNSFSVLQIPTSLMDNHLFGYSKNTSFCSYKEHILDLLNVIVNSEGVFTVDFHGRILNNTFFPEWGDSYKFLLKTVRDNYSYYADTPERIAQHWISREKLIENNSIDENNYPD